MFDKLVNNQKSGVYYHEVDFLHCGEFLILLNKYL